MNTQNPAQKLEANFSVLIMSIASSAALNLGLSPDPTSGKNVVNKSMAQFHIDLLIMLKAKTEKNLTSEEARLLDQLLNDLQIKFVNLR